MNITNKVLLIEDDDGHAMLVEQNLKRGGLPNPIERFRNGEELIQYLNETKDKNLIILLDVNMPVCNGFEVLKYLKDHPQFSLIPVIMLTTTNNIADINRCYNLGCSCYITKPTEYDTFVHVIQSLAGYISITEIPDL